MRRPKLPLNPEAVEKANSALKAETGGRPISMSSEDAALRKKWVDAYIEAAGPDSYTDTREERKKAPRPVQQCPLNDEENFVELQYSYVDGEGVAGASYEVVDLDTNSIVASGTLDNDGYCYADLPVSTKRIKYNFYNDPKFIKLHVKPVSNQEQAKVEAGWQDRITEKIKSGGEWAWGVVQGDFNENQTIGQIVANTAITLIPVVDQAGDIRDITANFKFLIYDKRYTDKAVWFSLVITIIGCIPEVGSLVKGIVKIIRKGIKSGKKVPVEELINAFNYFGKGNAVKYLQQLSANLPEFRNFVKSKLKGILNALINWLQKASTFLPGKLGSEAKNAKDSAEKVLESVDNQVDEVINDVKTKLDETLNEPVDLSIGGSVKTINNRTQVASKFSDLLITKPSKAPDPNAVPRGNKKKIKENDDKSTKDAALAENNAAEKFAKEGYDIEQLPEVKGQKNPDYKIEGNVFDCYSPTKAPPHNVYSNTMEKVGTNQTERVVLNLQNWKGDISLLQKEFATNSTEGLKELIVIDKNGSIFHLIP